MGEGKGGGRVNNEIFLLKKSGTFEFYIKNMGKLILLPPPPPQQNCARTPTARELFWQNLVTS